MHRAGKSVCLLWALLVVIAPVRAGDPPGAFHKNTVWGYKIKVPKGWRTAAITTKELWIASKHLGKRELEAVKSRTWAREAPEMWVVGFPHARKIGETGYTSYPEYVKAQDKFLEWGEGYEFTDKEETKVGGVKVTKWVISTKVKKSTGYGHAPRRVVAWVYHFDDIDFAVQFKILDEHYDGYAASFRGCLKSFKRIKRTAALPGTRESGKGETDVSAMTPAERERHLKDATERGLRTQIDALQGNWKHRRTKNFLVLYNAPEKFVRATTAHAETVRAHLQKFLGAKSAGYVAPGIIRIFATSGERDAYKAGAGVDKTGGDVLVAHGHGYVKDNELEILNQSILASWIHSRHELLSEMVPGWVSVALAKYMSMVRSKGKRITFTNEDWDRDSMRLAIKKGTYTAVVNLVGRRVEGIGDTITLASHEREAQERSFGFWLLTKGNRGKYKHMVRNTLAALLGSIEKLEAEAVKKHTAESKGKKRDPNEASARDWAIADVKAKELEIRRAALDAVFGGWNAGDWKKLTRAWLGDAK